MKKFWGTAKVVFGRFLLTAILIAPIAVYVSKFGFTISSDHGRWSEMGSAMSGIYGSILAWLAFGVLILQARMQNESNKHMSDQSYVQNAREDVDFYLGRLEEILDKPNFNGQTPRHVLNTEFAFADIEQLSGNNLKQLANSLNLGFVA